MKKTAMIPSFVTVLSIFAVCLAAAGDPQNGKKLFSDPQFAGSNNEKACINCHPGEHPFKSIPEGKDLDTIINTCITKALNGNALETDSQEMNDLKSYIISLGK